MIKGQNIIASEIAASNGAAILATNPSTLEQLEGQFFKASKADAEQALQEATKAYRTYKNIAKDKKAAFLRAIAEEITAIAPQLVARAQAESGLPLPRLQGEVGRTTGQLNLFANLVEEGSWVDATIDLAQPERAPLPKSDIRNMLVAIGPVVVFGASNFPLAFSVAGGDTASALASGCPVVVKAHPAHLGTSALVGEAIAKAVAKTGMPKGVFSLLFDDGYEIGETLVKHPLTKAVAFTGSYRGGMALVKMNEQREQPIPVFAEMGSINPVVFLPQAIATQGEELAKKYAGSITLGAGQFCTNPGLLLAVKGEGLDAFKGTLSSAMSEIPSATMLTEGIQKNYEKLSTEITSENGVELISESKLINKDAKCQSTPRLATVSAQTFISNAKLQEEIFGPYSLLVVAENTAELQTVIEQLHGQLTATLMAAPGELAQYAALIDVLTEKTGRLILNGVPTGVEVCSSMQHGGPFPSTNDSRFTSVGTKAIYRFARPIAWQDWEDALLPAELQASNPLKIWRSIDQVLTKD
jgi:alpha-ketoglutaric semialdehyde dehydrogenase